MAGNYLHVEGLVFKNGFTPTTEVISFKKDKNSVANNSRLTACVIDNFNNTERHQPETWLAIYGVSRYHFDTFGLIKIDHEAAKNHFLDHGASLELLEIGESLRLP